MDVVPADPKYWDTDPFAATTKDSVIFGRGALDTKTLGVVELEAFLALHRSKAPLDRDVIFMATADEEAGGNFGAGWVVKNHPEAFKGAGILLNEGGDGTIDSDGGMQFEIEVTQKTPYWLKLTSVGQAGTRLDAAAGVGGESSDSRARSAADVRVRAARRAGGRHVLQDDRADAPGEVEGRASTIPQKLIADHNTLMELQIEKPGAAGLLRNTCSITMLQASNKINVIPPEAQAQVDCRLLPDQDRDAFLREFKSVINDPDIKVETIIGFTPAISSTDNLLYRSIVDVIHRNYPKASIAPAVSTGFTDSHWFRDLGIAKQ